MVNLSQQRIVKQCTAAILFLFAEAAVAINTHHIKLYVSADLNSEQYIKNICITTNNGFSKSCGNGATRHYPSGEKLLKIVPYCLYKALGFDESCKTLRNGLKSPGGKGTWNIKTTLKMASEKNTNLLIITQCSTSWNPAFI